MGSTKRPKKKWASAAAVRRCGLRVPLIFLPPTSRQETSTAQIPTSCPERTT
ncbi:hypothetical protein ACHAWF_016855, partial [Thalassiosira exigua]